MDAEKQDKRIPVHKRVLCIFLFLIILLPVLVGIVVWYSAKGRFSSIHSSSPPSDYDATNAAINATVSTLTVTSTISEATESTPEEDSGPWINLRLPDFATPEHYNITIYPDIYDGNGWFYGNETIQIHILLPTKYILIHAHLLNITRTDIFSDKGDEVTVERTFFYEDNQFYVIETSTPLSGNQTVYLELQFDGSLTRDFVGIYRSMYTDARTGENRYLATSKFQPVEARRAFPCFDEPNMKAEFTVTLIHNPEYFALSNMPAETMFFLDYNSNLTATRFQRSVKMSTYLVCFVVCDFDHLNDTTKYGTEIRVFAAPDRISEASYSLKVMKTAMELFEDLFALKFPLPKNDSLLENKSDKFSSGITFKGLGDDGNFSQLQLTVLNKDMIAVPDFVAGAMEHWGLITYREIFMLYDETHASEDSKKQVAVFVAHEIAHMWFGNIVTMDWWDDLWLNEGFASFMEYLALATIEPQWEMLNQLVINISPVMVLDSGLNSHPVITDVNHPSEIHEVFDAITYNKGIAVINMLQAMVGKEQFFSGITKYLKKFEWSTAVTDDLWAVMGQVPGGYSVKEVMDTWTRQMGLPFINITLISDGNNTTVTATQQRFLADRRTEYDASESPFTYKWYVDLSFVTSSDKTGHQWMTKDDDTVSFSVPVHIDEDSGAWIKFNVNQTGWYRVNYPDFMWSTFADILHKDPNVLSPRDRSGLINDAFNLARAGYIGYDVALETTKYLSKEQHPFPWKIAYDSIYYISSMLQSTGEFYNWKTYILSRARPVLDEMAWEESGSYLNSLIRPKLIDLVCGFGDKQCLRNASIRFRDWIDKGVNIPPHMKDSVYKFGMMSSERQSDWEFMWNKYITETSVEEQIELLKGMGKTKDIWLLMRYLDYTKDESKVRSHDVFNVILTVATNPYGKALAWDWTRSNWEYLVKRFTLVNRDLGLLIPQMTSSFNTEFKLQEVRSFFDMYPESGAGARSRDRGLESIERNIDWMKNNRNSIRQWLEKQVDT